MRPGAAYRATALVLGLALPFVALALPDGDTWKQDCAAGTAGIYKCCKEKFDDCTENLEEGTIAWGQCRAAHKKCVSTHTSPVGDVVNPDLIRDPRRDPRQRQPARPAIDPTP